MNFARSSIITFRDSMLNHSALRFTFLKVLIASIASDSSPAPTHYANAEVSLKFPSKRRVKIRGRLPVTTSSTTP